MRCTVEADKGNVRLEIEREGSFPLPSDRVRVVLSAGDKRMLAIDAATLGVPVVGG